ncbi:MAG: hypothetical protein FJX60_06895 [Alphaproteobacteria bacterium]|nr:hypothetical protein [Alphaproteobacteria bacterium]
MPSAVMHFYSGQPMHFYSGVDTPFRGAYDNPKTAVEAIVIGKARRYDRRIPPMRSRRLNEPAARSR